MLMLMLLSMQCCYCCNQIWSNYEAITWTVNYGMLIAYEIAGLVLSDALCNYLKFIGNQLIGKNILTFQWRWLLFRNRNSFWLLRNNRHEMINMSGEILYLPVFSATARSSASSGRGGISRRCRSRGHIGVVFLKYCRNTCLFAR